MAASFFLMAGSDVLRQSAQIEVYEEDGEQLTMAAGSPWQATGAVRGAVIEYSMAR